MSLSIAVVVGSLRKDSHNRRLALAMQKLLPADVAFEHVDIAKLPLYDQDDDARQGPEVRRLKEQIAAADGVIFVTPEYNRSIPGVLKNAIDHGSRPYGSNSWARKPTGVIGISVGAIGTFGAQQHLRNVLAYLDAPTLGQPEALLTLKEGFFDAAGEIGAASREFVNKWVAAYVAFARAHAAGQAERGMR